MTSPAQLKYLDAMGIPVWVSRDLVSFDELIANDSVEQNSQENLKPATQPNTNNNQTNHANNNSARSILDSLENNSKVIIPSDSKNTNNLDNLVAESVSKTQIDTSPQTEQTFVSSSIEPSTHNLLFKTAQHYVFANGAETADWMIIGHSPEAYNGIGHEPFAGEAGELINNMMIAAGHDNPRHQTYMINVLNVNQSVDNSTNNKQKLELQQKLSSVIDKVKPKIILLVGQIAAQNLLESEDPLIVMRSKIYQLTNNKIPCVVTYYPSYLLQKPIDKRKAWNDLKLAMSLVTDVS